GAALTWDAFSSCSLSLRERAGVRASGDRSTFALSLTLSRRERGEDMLRTCMTSLGIDIGGSSVKLALVRGGQTVWKSQSETYARPTRQQLADVIRSAIAGRFDPTGAAVGVCVPGTR